MYTWRKGGDQDHRGVERVEQPDRLREVLRPRPAHGGDRPQRRAEPRVEHIGILLKPVVDELLLVRFAAPGDADVDPVAVGAGLALVRRALIGGAAEPGEVLVELLRDLLGAELGIRRVEAAPHRDPVPPPELAADAPVPQVLVPGLVGPGVSR
jgi:hypothetical protein